MITIWLSLYCCCLFYFILQMKPMEGILCCICFWIQYIMQSPYISDKRTEWLSIIHQISNTHFWSWMFHFSYIFMCTWWFHVLSWYRCWLQLNLKLMIFQHVFHEFQHKINTSKHIKSSIYTVFISHNLWMFQEVYIISIL